MWSIGKKRKISDYRHNWTYSVDEDGENGRIKYSYYLAYKHNTEKPGIKFSLILEYNPNKCEGDAMLNTIMQRFFSR